MIRNQWLCCQHDEQITNICLEDHFCLDRRLCNKCIQTTHSSFQHDKMISVSDFMLKLNDKLKGFEEDNFRIVNQSFSIIKREMMKQFEELQNLIDNLIFQIEKEDSDILALKQKMTAQQPQEFTNQEYNFLKEIYQGQILERRFIWRKNFKLNITNQILNFFDESKEYLNKLKAMNPKKITEQLEKNIKLVGIEQFGQRSGSFYYIQEDGSTDFAGEYEFGLKQGQWQDYLGYDNTRGKRVFNNITYIDGVRIYQEQTLSGKLDQELLKYGLWQESDGKWNQIKQEGEYQNGLRIGLWKAKYNESIIGKGEYDSFGQKTGQWTEPLSTYDNGCQVILQGQYKKNIKCGKWSIFYRGEKIGCGEYNENGIKDGEWTDLHEDFNDFYQLIYNGQYQNGQKFGKWLTFLEGKQSGSGSYDERGVKNGIWTELLENFHQHQTQFTNSNFKYKVIQGGQYKNGIKFGKWSIAYRKEIVGGGYYDETGQKYGKWIDVNDNYHEFCQVTFQGEYKNGVRVGKWISVYDKKLGKKFAQISLGLSRKIIGGGSYDEKGAKSGLWVDVPKQYGQFCQLTFLGEYRNGIKIGNWSAQYREWKLEGGEYNQNGIKMGKWNDLHQNFDDAHQIKNIGEYCSGVKVGKWTTVYADMMIGGGVYDQKGIKIGKWIDFHENFYGGCQVTFTGNYDNGIKIGTWHTEFEEQIIGFDTYDQKGKKIGSCTQLHLNFNDRCQVVFTGEYNKGKRVGVWTTYYGEKKVGGGSYNQNGLKVGSWIDLYEGFDRGCEITFSGQYIDGIKQGEWVIEEENEKIGGGAYNQKGEKTGKWMDLYEHFYFDCKVLYSGLYENEIRIDQWLISFEKKKIGGGLYSDSGIKINYWTEPHPNFNNKCQITQQGEYKNGIRFGKWIVTNQNDVINIKYYKN